ncbi:MAG TPA: cytochrome c oxidase subunit 3 [Steroidobacteraceae bacterium]|jgi:cytochrome c oxidase subunit III|nr:cytochrome c oxidase subunit 3 [Steroidobacteraceae bacterium]
MAQAHAPTSTASEKYYVPHGSPWPIIGSIALFTTVGGGALWLNHVHAGPWVVTLGLALLAFMFIGWFGTVIRESEGRLYNEAVDRSFRMGMMWFIFSEVMFFAGFFGALLYARQFSVPWLGGEGTKLMTKVLRGDTFEAVWPTNGPGQIGGEFQVIPAWGLPAYNTAILLASGVTITIAHHALRAGNRKMLNLFLALTFLLGFLFVYLQATEYIEAYTHHNLKLSTGIYGSTFFPLTAFHGFHVTMGAIMLVVIWFRCLKGHFTPTQHFAFEGVAWYWHFVDVVWLGLFIFVYWL